MHTVDWTSYISIVLAVFTLGIVLWNYRGTRTLFAATVIVIATLIVGVSELVSGNTTHYYIGCAILFLGVWINGSFVHFARKWLGAANDVQGEIVKVDARG